VMEWQSARALARVGCRPWERNSGGVCTMPEDHITATHGGSIGPGSRTPTATNRSSPAPMAGPLALRSSGRCGP
jgi:hypothetical protein